MLRFSIYLARKVVEVNAFFPSTEEFCRDYLTKAIPDCSVTILREDLNKEYFLDLNITNDEAAEISALQRKLARLFIDYNAVLFHGVTVIVDRRAFLFTGPSETDVFNHARLWLDIISGSYILNADNAFLRMQSYVSVYGTPWRGKEGLRVNEIMMLDSICIIERDATDHIHPVTSGKDTLDALRPQVYRLNDASLFMKSINLLEKMIQTVKLYRLGVNNDLDAAYLSYKTMLFSSSWI